MEQIAIIGCGGVGRILAPVLAKMTRHKLLLIDGDSYELRNLDRQLLKPTDVGHNKAFCLSEELKSNNPFIRVDIIDAFYTEYSELPDSVKFVFVCVDNNNARKAITQTAKEGVLYVFCANEEETGDAFIWQKGNPFPEELLAEDDAEDQHHDCQTDVVRLPQLAMANMAAATAGIYLWYVHTHQDFEGIRKPVKHRLAWNNFSSYTPEE